MCKKIEISSKWELSSRVGVSSLDKVGLMLDLLDLSWVLLQGLQVPNTTKNLMTSLKLSSISLPMAYGKASVILQRL